MTISLGFSTIYQGWAPTAAAAIVTNSTTGQLILTVAFNNRSGSTVQLYCYKNTAADPFGWGGPQPLPVQAGYSGVYNRRILGPSDTLFIYASAAAAIALDVTGYAEAT